MNVPPGPPPSRLVVAAGDTYVQAHEILTGRKVWEIRLSESGPATVFVGAGRVFVGVGATLFCIDLESGQGLWKVPLYGGVGGMHSRPTLLVEGERVLVCANRALQCFALDGQELWREYFPRDDPPSLATEANRSQYDVNTRGGTRYQ